MLLVFVIAAVALVLVLEFRLSRNALTHVREDHWPEERLVDPEEVFHLTLSVENTAKRYVLFLGLEEQLPKEFETPLNSRYLRRSAEGGRYISITTWLRPYQQVQFRVPVSIAQRGRYVLHSLKVSGGDFLGLREEVRRLERFRAVIVAPKEAPEAGLSEVLGGFLGDVSVRRFLHEDPVLTAGFREYTGREPMKAISWMQSARGQGLMVKTYDHTAEPTVSVLLNVDSEEPEREELLEKCFSLTRTVCRTLEDRGIAYDFLTNADLLGAETERTELGDGLGTQHFTAVLECLGRASYYTRFSAEQLLENALETRETRGRILITPGAEFAQSQSLRRLRELSDGNLLVLRAAEVAAW